MRRLSTLFVALAVGGTLVGTARQSPQPQVTFRSAVDLVDVEVSVLDRYRLPVRGLSAADFTILEEGRARPIVAFTPIDLPPRVMPPAKWMDTIAPDIHSNAFVKEGRLIVILLDRSIEAADYPEARRIAEAAVNQLRAGDMAAIAWSLPGVPQNFTGDRQRLLDVIRQPILNVPGGSGATTGECLCGACSMEAIARIAEGIQDVTWRRKIVLFVGHRLPGRGAGGCTSVIDAARKRALRAAEAGNVTIHVLDPRGLETLGSSASARGVPSQATGANLRRIAALTALTTPTGGRHVNRNQPSEVLPEVFRESGSYYVLGFQPAYTGADGRFRRITVKANRPDVTLQARRGFYAPGRQTPPLSKLGDGLPPKLVEAISGLWPKTDLGLSIGAAPVAKPGVRGGVVAVVLRVQQDFRPNAAEGSARRTVSDAPGGATAVSVLAGAFDSNGRAIGFDRQAVTVMPRRIGDHMFDYEVAARLELKPGRYEIRAAVEDLTLGQTGSAYTYVDVPDFAQELVSLSGVFLQAGPGGPPVPGARLSDLIPVTPTTRRQFARTEQITAFVHEYQGQTRMFMPGYATSEIFDDSDTRVHRQEQRILPVSGEHRALDFSVDVPVRQLSPGAYVLTIQVRHGNETARRDVRFEVQ